MKTIRLLAFMVCLLTLACGNACSPVKDQAIAASSPAAVTAPGNQSPISVTVTPPFPTPAVATSLSIDKKVAQLLEDYQSALDEEMAHGDTVTVKNANGAEQKMLNGKSKEKMDNLWRKTTAKIDNLKARPAAERQKVIDMLQARCDEDCAYFGALALPPYGPLRDWNIPVGYLTTTRLPSYSQSARMEVYFSMTKIYFVDIGSGQIIEIEPRLMLIDPPYPGDKLTPVQLEQKARQYVLFNGVDVNQSALTPVFSNQVDNFTFRWEDRGRRQPDGGPRFIEVNYANTGLLLSYFNTLPLP